jgi:D-alanyl-D-alanine carboxypeptidase (penicillin-binding protein 5/6)
VRETRVITSAVVSPEADEIARTRRLVLEERYLAERRAHERRLRLRRRRARIRRRRLGVVLVLAVASVGIWAVLGASSPSLSSAHGALAPPSFSSTVYDAAVLPGQMGIMPWPTTGQSAVAVEGSGLMAASPNEKTVPIASLTKMMTAYLVLRDHPLTPRANGPSFTMTAADAAAWVRASQSDESNVVIRTGEVLTERELLEALLLPSADNIADYLAAWDAGSIPKFVAQMNRTATALGLQGTRYADASGVNPESSSTAASQATLAAMLMQNPVVRSIVNHPSLPFPVAGTITNYNPALGVDGIVGIKSGYTSEAEGCLATAAFHNVDGHQVLVVAVTLGQPNGLTGAGTSDEALLAAADRSLATYQPVAAYHAVGTVTIGGGSPVPVRVAGTVPVIVGWPGFRISEQILAPRDLEGHSRVVGELVLSGSFGVMAKASVVVASGVAAAPPTTLATSTAGSLPTTRIPSG